MDIGIFYGSTNGNTENAAKLIQNSIGSADIKNIADATVEDLNKYKILILGSSTWGLGDLQDDWEEAVSKLDKIDFSGKKVALFGCGDQEGYPDTFINALGTIYQKIEGRGADFIGRWPVEDYTFDESTAVKDGSFVGLALDEDNQEDLTDNRIIEWVKSLPL